MSSNMEGLGTIVLDAGITGVPVVATNAGGLPEAVLNNQTGLVTPVGEPGAFAQAVLRLLDEPALGKRLAQAAQERVRGEFSVPFMAGRYIQTYREALGISAPVGNASY
jgi:glycosyltransferase involved in cell wall biosynthesis